MNPQERYYQKTVGAIAVAMLLFWGLINLFSLGYEIFAAILLTLPISTASMFVADQLFYAVGYFLCFLIPALLLRPLLRSRKCKVQPMKLEGKPSPYLPLMILAFTALCICASFLNQMLSGIFDVFASSEEDLSLLYGMEPYEVVLNLIVICVIPGFCEELLFRGAILTNCLPFGRPTAILISSLLFAVMHQNFDQLFYTFVAGLLLGLIYERTGNLWNCIVVHVCNNFFSVIEESVWARMGGSERASLILMLMEGVVLLLGCVSAVILILKLSHKPDPCENGAFGVSLPAADSYAACPIPPNRARVLFLTPAMLIFFSLSLIQTVLRAILF
ncbi:MAG: CPBP family intramembrane metalloprotease [Clostridia bacterium]|nr:CPBP family intramembrane metalloprotease [Clostridia bacterium]